MNSCLQAEQIGVVMDVIRDEIERIKLEIRDLEQYPEEGDDGSIFALYTRLDMLENWYFKQQDML